MRTAATPGGPPARLREGVDHAHGRTTWYRSGWSGPGLRRGSGRQLVFGGRTGVTTPAAQGAEEGKHRVGVADQVERQAGGDRPVDPLPLRGSCACGHFRRHKITDARPLLLICGWRGRRFRRWPTYRSWLAPLKKRFARWFAAITAWTW